MAPSPQGWAVAGASATGATPTPPCADVVQWVMRRNCSLAPRQLLAVYASLCIVSLAIAGAFWWHGAGFVAAFAGLELLAFGAAIVVYARHASDRETITLDGEALQVEHRCGDRVERHELRSPWLRVEAARGRAGLVELVSDGRRVSVGRYIRPHERSGLAAELRRALGATRGGTPGVARETQWQTK